MNDLIYFLLIAEFFSALVAAARVTAGKPALARDRLYIAPLLVAGIMAAVQVGVGVAQKAKAAKLARANKRPELKDNPYVEMAYDITAKQKGLSDASMQAYTTNSDRNLASSINSIMKSGGSSNNIAELYEGSQTGLRTLAMQNEEVRMRNLNQFLTKGLQPKADQDRDKWFLNQYKPFEDRNTASTRLSEQGMDSIMKGFNTFGGAALAEGLNKDPKAAPDGPDLTPAQVSQTTIPTNYKPNAVGANPRYDKIDASYTRFDRPLRFDAVSGTWK